MAGMRLTTFSDYCLRTLIYLAARPGGLATVEEIARHHAMSRNHLTKVVHHLGQGGWLRTVRGRGGGVALARPAERILIGEVVRASEPDFHMADCFDQQRATCRFAGQCRVQDVLGLAIGAYLSSLDQVSLADLVRT